MSYQPPHQQGNNDGYHAAPTNDTGRSFRGDGGQQFEIIEMMGHDGGNYPPYYHYGDGTGNQVMNAITDVLYSLKDFLETPRGKRIFGAIFLVGLAVTYVGTGSTDPIEHHPNVNIPLDSEHHSHQFVPHFTRAHIIDNPTSPQAHGVDYVLNHPDLDGMPLWRQKQLLALTTFWFGLHPRPTKQHMIGHKNECEWWQFDPVCDGEGRYTSMKSDKFSFLDTHHHHGATYITHGTLPQELSLLVELKELTLANHSLTGTVPTMMGHLTALTGLHLYANELSGPIPSELGRLTRLQHLALESNSLTGKLPATLGHLVALKRLTLGFNQLTGSLPPVLGHLVNLRELELQINYIDGTLPSELGKMTNVEVLRLDHNRIHGEVPSELGKLTRLESLNLQTNDLSGMVPSTLNSLTSLTDCHFFENDKIAGHYSTPLECMHFGN